MKWENIEPTQGIFTFTGGDQIVALAQANGQLVRGTLTYSAPNSPSIYRQLLGHNCVWHQQLPAWITSGTFDNATLLSIVENHCSTLVSHYKGQM